MYFLFVLTSWGVCKAEDEDGVPTGVGAVTGLGAGAAGEVAGFDGDVARRLAADSRRCRAGSIRFCGVVSAIVQHLHRKYTHLY